MRTMHDTADCGGTGGRFASAAMGALAGGGNAGPTGSADLRRA